MDLPEGWNFDAPWLRTGLPGGGRLDVLAGEGEVWDPEPIDVHVYTSDGRHLTGEIMSVTGLSEWFAMRREPFWTSNLVLVGERSLPSIRDAITHLLESGEADDALLVCDD